MEHRHASNTHTDVLRSLNSLPRKMLSMHGKDNISEFVLYDFCHKNYFNFKKAAYFVDNTDFNCFKGVAGIDTHEDNFCNDVDVWKNADGHNTYMKQSPFNQNVRNLSRSSLHVYNGSQQEVIGGIANELIFNNPEYYVWDMKHDNHGVLIFERSTGDTKELDEHLLQSVYLFSFCPVH